MSRRLKWISLVVAALALPLAAAVVLLDGDNLRGNLARLVNAKTGRQLSINGDLAWRLDWPRIRLHAVDVTFANPPWAREKQMFAASAVDLAIELPPLLWGTLSLPEVQLDRPSIFFEIGADGRKNWLLDREQQNDGSRVSIGRLTLAQARVAYDDPMQKIAIVAEISSRRSDGTAAQAPAADPGIGFSVKGKYLGLPLTASGEGGAVIALQDERTPYPLTVVATVGPTTVRAEGTVTGLTRQSGFDAKVALRGSTLSELYEILDIPLPETRAYNFTGHLMHGANGWRYEKFSGRIGQSDVTGSLRLTDAVARPMLEGDLAFESLNLADLGPVVGAGAAAPALPTSLRGRKVAGRETAQSGRALPAAPFRRDRWTTVDADVILKAQTILRPKALPLEHLTTRLRMRDSVLTLDPLDFGAAGGDLVGVIRLDGQQTPIRAHAKLGVRKLLLGKLLPTVPLAHSSTGQINGEIELVGHGDSIARMLATAEGKVGLVVEGGKTSKLLMQQIALHVPELILQHLTGDELIDIRCGVADFNVENGIMKIGVLVLDTDVTKVVGEGSVDLAKETLSLTLVPIAKRISLFALRGPISVQGELAHPDLAVDVGRVGARGVAALLLGAVNPALSLLALADPGAATDSDCTALTKHTRAPWSKTAPSDKRAPG